MKKRYLIHSIPILHPSPGTWRKPDHTIHKPLDLRSKPKLLAQPLPEATRPRIRLELGLHRVPEPLVVEQALAGTDGADGDVLVPQLPAREVHDALAVDGVDVALDLGGGHAAAGGDDLAADVLSKGGGAVEGEEDRGLELGLGALDLGLGDVGAETHPLADGEVDEIVDTVELVGHEVDTPEADRQVSFKYALLAGCHKKDAQGRRSRGLPSVAVARREAHEAVRDVVVVDERGELAAGVGRVAHGLVVVADDGLGDESGEVVGVAPADTLNGEGDVDGGHGVVTDTDIGADEVGLLLRLEAGVVLGALLGELGEVLLGKVDEPLVGDAASTDEDHAVGGVVVLDVVGELGPRDVADVLAGAEDGAAQGLVLESGGVEVVEDDLLNLLLDLLGLAEDDVALALDGALLELGVLEDVGEDVDALRNVGVDGLGEVDGVLALWWVRGADTADTAGWGWPGDVPRCRRSGARPCSQSPARAASGSCSRCPVDVRVSRLSMISGHVI